MNNPTILWRETLRNIFFALVLFAGLIALCLLAEHYTSLTLLHFADAAFCVGIPASVIGVAYVLTIRNPLNYTGFYVGILMSLLLAVQFFLQGNYDLTCLYIAVFVPFQAKSIATWKHSQAGTASNTLQPEFLSLKAMLLSLLVFLLIIAFDYLLATFLLNHDALSDNVVLKLMGGLLIASSVLANFWLIYKKNDAWIYWVLYSTAGIVFYILVNNVFSVVLFSFFLVINSMAGVAWIRNTPSHRMGWLRFVR
ncbi:MAG: nicotinamide mononucleotide transporter family protein [Paludibacter sp.]|nr:nicotinamide mononucleotide transporter family protein [Bacteroidales bacterium]MCM1069364.1 nicotinamide mononucleotide transporter family protein [Prevotella sp.]MCM1353884.1 nicotinamide mononucleotide transporter family protein [Bacteroides sp.]MCM1442866.1 nicotinamide mononucleotide transporter family protein [Muribaculum sp.]MCM1481911.1 nicotinamide mononucleotide transporter family protein [Paludibacter sp.]